MLRLFFVFLCCLSGCSPASPEDFHSEGTYWVRELVKDLRQVHSREDLIVILPKFRKKMQKIVDLMVITSEYAFYHPDERKREIAETDRYYSDLLLAELVRLYAIDGCRELIEQAERSPLHQLDACLRRLNS